MNKPVFIKTQQNKIEPPSPILSDRKQRKEERVRSFCYQLPLYGEMTLVEYPKKGSPKTDLFTKTKTYEILKNTILYTWFVIFL